VFQKLKAIVLLAGYLEESAVEKKHSAKISASWVVQLALFIAIILQLSPTRALGQGATGALNGAVTDPTSAVIPGAKVTLKNLDTQVSQEAVTNSAGRYVFVAIPPGRYTIEVTKEGFKVSTTSEFTLAVNQTLTQDVQLFVGTATQQVTVQTTEASVETTTTELGTAIEQNEVNSLPLNGRNFTQLLALTPGVSPISTGQNSGGGNSFAGSAIGSFTFPSVNGQGNRSNMFLLDGFTDYGFIGNYAVAPIIDDIQEFKVQSHNDSSAFGGSLGGIINVVTKGGTQEYHGDVWEFFRNSALDARNYFQTAVTPYKQNQFGGAAGGPVLPGRWRKANPMLEKLYFFAAYEGFRSTRAANTLDIIPTQAQLGGDFSGGNQNPIFNPYTTRADPNNPGQLLRDPFPNNIIPTALVNQPLEAYRKAIYPVVNQLPANGYNFVDPTPNILDSDTGSMRVDEQFTDQITSYFRFSKFYSPSTSATGIPGILSAANTSGYNYGGSGTWTSKSGTKILTARFGKTIAYSVTDTQFPASLANAYTIGQFNLQTVTGFVGGRNFNMGEGFSGYQSVPGGSYQGNQIADIYEGAADFTRVSGRHTLQMGVDINTNDNSQPILFINDSYSATPTSNLESALPTGDALASGVLGLPSSVNRRNVNITTHGGWEDGFYIQDQWKASPKLQINVGFRYDITLWPIYGSHALGNNYVGDTDLDTGQYIMAAVPPGCYTGATPCIPTADGSLPANVIVTPKSNQSIIHNSFDNWQPRFGFSYQAIPGTVVKAGIGRFFDNWAAVQQLSTNYQGNWPDTTFLLANNLNATTPDPTTGQNPLALGTNGAQILPAATPFNQVNWMIDPYYKNAYSIQYNFGIEQQVKNNTVLQANYVGAHSLRTDSGSYRNTALYPAPGPIADRQPFSYITPTYYDKSVANSNYNAFQFQARTIVGKKLTLLGSYTWSKTITLGCDGFFGSEGCSVQDPYNLKADRSVAGYDLPQNFSFSWVYQLPFGRGQHFDVENSLLNEAIGGWSFQGIYTAHSGIVFNNNAGNDDLENTGNVVERADRLCKNPYNGSRNVQYLNQTCFANPAAYTFGSEPRNDLRTPHVTNTDLTLEKVFPLGKEQRSIVFRTDFFNAWNQAAFGPFQGGTQPDNTVTDANFGLFTGTAQTEREIQFALKITF
jgi:outer membrane receptor protein involved in Fe transport